MRFLWKLMLPFYWRSIDETWHLRRRDKNRSISHFTLIFNIIENLQLNAHIFHLKHTYLPRSRMFNSFRCEFCIDFVFLFFFYSICFAGCLFIITKECLINNWIKYSWIRYAVWRLIVERFNVQHVYSKCWLE